MNGVFSAVVGTFILFPFIVTILFLIIMKRIGRAPKSVMGLAADVTTPFLFIGIYVISYTIFGIGTAFYIAGIAIVIAIILAFIERGAVKDFRIVRLLRKIWRFYFLFSVAVYLLLISFGTVLKIIEYLK
ncbi:DUF3397 family protein [Sporosarcina sp. JAI121]|uniref:DUF3397 family protein n=1 Tax=Sporosarcina sp. JAI121 TaxID=2723064 RepID=UPI0015CD8C83|nr:DUF3397 family protein [Sporosarcina sp. JAI121]NYF24132.1 hypothetical protein [Sporosarcina sp. JAI121]